MRVFVIGDIYGRPGRRALRELLPELVQRHRPDIVVANAENAAGGRGLTPPVADEILDAHIDVLTAGNHTLEHDAIFPYLTTHPILRPANAQGIVPGRGWIVHDVRGIGALAVISLQGRVFMEGKGYKMESPFEVIDNILPELEHRTKMILIDFHAEATSEKRAMAWHLDGRISVLVGTHTHVQTADEEIFPQGMAYISDLGMTGPHASVVGLDKDTALQRFLTGEKNKFKVAEAGVRLEGVLVDIDEATGKARSIQRVREACAGS